MHDDIREIWMAHDAQPMELFRYSRKNRMKVTTNQRRTIQEDGTFITEKFGFWISRTRWCHIKLGRYGEEGETVQWFHHSQ